MSGETHEPARDGEPHAAARAALRRALPLASRGALASARREVRAALAQAAGDPVIFAAAGIVLFVTRDYTEALEALQRAADHGGSTRVLWLIRDRASRLGWERDALEALRAGAAAEPGDPRWIVARIALFSRRKAWDLAWREGAALERIAADHPAADFAAAWMELANVAAMRGDPRGAETCIARALRRARTGPYLSEAAGVERRVGRWDAAREHFVRACGSDPRDPEPRIGLAELALWSGDHAAAAEHADAARALGASASADRVLGAIAWIEGRRDDAVGLLGRARDIAPRDPELPTWLAEIAIREGRHDEAHELLSRAVAVAGGDLFPAHVLRLRLQLEEARPHEALASRHAIANLGPSLRAICPDHGETFEDASPTAWRAMLDTALARMHGNRSRLPTYRESGALHLVPHRRDPRLESRRILERLRVEDPDALLDELFALERVFPSSSLPLAHAGELQLWLGRYRESRRTLERAIAHTLGTRWAWIGLTLLDVFDGAPERALATSARGVEVMSNTKGPAVYVHRGEALRVLGRYEEAEADLTRAVELNRDRVGAWLNLALLRLDTGRESAAREATAEVLELAPSLVTDAGRELGLELFGDAGGELIALDAPALRALLAHALSMTRGNRSSSTTSYLNREGILRFTHHTRGAALHARSAEELDLAARLLDHGLGELPRPGEQRHRGRGRDPGLRREPARST